MTNAETADLQTPDTQTDAPMVFHCTACGECCTGWSITLEKSKGEELLALDWVQERLKAHNLRMAPVSRKSLLIPMTKDNYCVFLGDDKYCMIESKGYRHLKPAECKRFPFAVASSKDDDLVYDASAFCKSIAENALLPMKEVIPSESMMAKGDLRQDASVPIHSIPISRFRRMPWKDYPEFMRSVRSIFQQDDLTPEQCLKQVQELIVGKKKFHQSTDFGFHKAWYRWIPTCFLRKPYNTLSLIELLKGSRGRYIDPVVLGLDLPVTAFPKSRWNHDALDPYLKGFLHHLIQRKVAFTQGYTLQGLLSLVCMGYFMVHWHARTLADLSGKLEPDATDVLLAIRLTERYYTGHQPNFISVFTGHGVFSHLHKLVLG